MFLIDRLKYKMRLPERENALPGREEPLETASHHFVNGNALKASYPKGSEIVYFALGCYWGAERMFWNLPGVHVTAVGNIAGMTLNPTYQEVCSGQTGHAEAVMVVYDPTKISFEKLLKTFWEGHDPTQGMRQGNDVGTQYRSGIYTTSPYQKDTALASKATYQAALNDAGKSSITTEIMDAPEFYFAEEYHQQYLAKNKDGYCGIGGTGVSCPIGTGVAAS